MKQKYQLGTKFVTKCELSAQDGCIYLNVREGSSAIITGVNMIADSDNFDNSLNIDNFRYTIAIYETKEDYDRTIGIVYYQENEILEKFDKLKPVNMWME